MTAPAASAPAPAAAPAPTAAPAVTAAAAPVHSVQVAQAIGTPLVPTGPQAPTAGADRVPTGPQAPATAGPALGRIVTVDPPGAGQAESLQVFPGMRVVLQNQAFDPNRATYVVQGNDLVVRTQGNGDVVLLDFFRTDGSLASLSVAGGQANSSGQLLSLAYLEGNDTLIKPGAGPTGPQAPTGGNASFSAYDQGDIGPGLDPLGPLGPTDLRRGLPEEDIDPFDTPGDGEDDGNPNPPPPPEGETPVVTTTSTITASIVDNSVGFNPGLGRPLPTLVEGEGVQQTNINGVDPRLVTIDETREVSIVFQSEIAALKNTLIAFFVQPDGTIVDSRVVFPNVNNFDTSPFFQDGTGPLNPGDTVSLGVVEKGLQVGLALIQGGWEIHDGLLTFGTIKILDPVTLLPFNVNTSTGLPLIIHTKPNGIESIIYGKPFWTVDDDYSTPNANPFNFDGLGHVVSGFDQVSGDVVVAFEDVGLPAGQIDETPRGGIYSDRDFNDAIFQIHFGPSVEGETVFFGNSIGSLLADVTDKDSTALQSATVAITAGSQTGDKLELSSLVDGDNDGFIDGTSIAVTVVSDTELLLEGEDTLENYEQVLNDVRFVNDSNDIAPGDRTIEVTVVDEDGNESEPTSTVLTAIEDEIILGAGADEFDGTENSEAIAGENGDDLLFGAGGNDLLNGGDGDDILDGGEGDDQLRGMSGQDSLTGGEGADIFVHTALGDGQDVVTDFDLDEGDKFDLEALLAGTGFDPNAVDTTQWIRFEAADLDGGGAANDLAVRVDRDGAGTDYEFGTVFAAFNPVGLDRITIENGTTFGNAA